MSGREAGIDPLCRLELSFRYVPIPIVLGGNQSEGNVSSGQRRVECNGSLRSGFRSRHGFVRRKNQIRGVVVGVGQAAVSQGVCRIVIDGILQVVKGFAVPVFGVVIGREVSAAQIVGVGGGVCGGAFVQSTLLLASKGAGKIRNDTFCDGVFERKCIVGGNIGRTVGELGIWEDPKDRALMIAQLQQQGPTRNAITRLRTKSARSRPPRVKKSPTTLAIVLVRCI